MRAHLVDGALLYSFEGRIKDNIDRGSEKISAEEIERFLRDYPGIGQVAVIGIADPVYGERVCACVTAQSGDFPSVSSMGAFLEMVKLAKFKWPERVEIFSEMPLTEIGKIDKKKLRQMVEGRTGKNAL
jgi:non-ribosomal peptide synthetase component E (peptide arylation enzyme)